MQCRNCGTEMPDSASFCRSCGERASIFRTEAIRNARPVAPLQADEDDDYRTKVVPEAQPHINSKKIAVPSGIVISLAVIGLLSLVGVVGWSIYRLTVGEQTSTNSVSGPTTPTLQELPRPNIITPSPQLEPTPARINSQTSAANTLEPHNSASDGTYPNAIVRREVDPKFQVWVYRIKFPRGAYEAVVRDKIPKLNRYYVFSAQAYQTLSVSFRSPSPSAFYWVKYHDTQEQISPDSNGYWSGVITRTGDYEINVDCGTKVNGTITPIEMVLTLK